MHLPEFHYLQKVQKHLLSPILHDHIICNTFLFLHSVHNHVHNHLSLSGTPHYPLSTEIFKILYELKKTQEIKYFQKRTTLPHCHQECKKKPYIVPSPSTTSHSLTSLPHYHHPHSTRLHLPL